MAIKFYLQKESKKKKKKNQQTNVSYRRSLTTSAKENRIDMPFQATLANVPSFSQISRDLEEFLQKEIKSAFS